MKSKRSVTVAAAVVLVIAAGLLPGRTQPEPAALLGVGRAPNGWLLRPAGTQILAMRAPTGLALSPDGSTLVAVTSGAFDEDVIAVDTRTFAETLLPVGDAFQGATLDANGNLWVSGGSRNRVFQYRVTGPVAAPLRYEPPVPGTPNDGIQVIGYPGNMVRASDGRLYVAGTLSVPSSVVARARRGAACVRTPICSVVNVIDTSDPLAPSPAVHPIPVGRDAFGLALNQQSHKLYVTNWADGTDPARRTGTISVVDVTRKGAEREVQRWPVGQHPSGIALSPNGRRLVVANSADDTITIFSLGTGGLVQFARTISIRPFPRAALGVTPLAVSFSRDGRLLFVAMAGLNAVEVLTPSGARIPRTVTVHAGGKARRIHVPATYIPTGWYPDAMVVGSNRLYVSNLKGNGAGPGTYQQVEFQTGSSTEGTISAIDLPADARARGGQLDRWTATVMENNNLTPLFDQSLKDPASNPCIAAPIPGGKTTFSRALCDPRIDPRTLHVVVMFNENKTFDSYFGDIGASLDAAANPAFTQYGLPVTTNQHRLAEAYNLNDAFWTDGEASILGHPWMTGGYTTEYNELTWSPEFDEDLRGNRSSGQYDGQLSGPSSAAVAAQERAMRLPRETIFDRFANRRTNPLGLTQAIYSDDVREGSIAQHDQVPLALWGLGPKKISGSDITFPDTDRAQLFVHGSVVSRAWDATTGPPPPTYGHTIGFSPADQRRFTLDGWTQAYRRCIARGGDVPACQRAMPNFVYMVLPENHTVQVDPHQNPAFPTQQSMVADNDLAVGRIVQALSLSPFWRNTIVLVTQDDTQYTGDHIDIHRSFVLAAGGLARSLGPRGLASHQGGSLPSLLKTIEAMFRLAPLTLFDQRAIPLHEQLVSSWDAATSTPYRAVTPPVLVEP